MDDMHTTTQGDQSQAAATGGTDVEAGGAFVKIQSLGTESSESARVGELFVTSGGGPPALAPRESDNDADTLVRNSWSVLSIVTALLDNVYGAPVDVEPVVDPASEEGKRTIRRWIRLQRAMRGTSDRTHLEISQASLDQACGWLDARIEYELARAEGFYDTCGVDHDLQTTRILLGFDLETRGRAHLEVLRGMDGTPRAIQWVSSRFIRIEPKKDIVGFHDVDVHNPLVQIEEVRYRRFHGFYQVTAAPGSGVWSYFREFGDPRIRSRRSGQRGFATLEDLQRAETGPGGAGSGAHYAQAGWPPGTPATEILHFALSAPWAESTGLAPWYAAKPEALGIRELAQENRGLLSGQLIPLLLMMVSGGARIGPDQQEYWQRQFQSIRPGERGLLIMQVLGDRLVGSGARSGGEPKIQIENTRPAQQDDALGLKYTKEADRAVRRLYRFPAPALGDLEGVNENTADLALRFAESQIYEPRRDAFNRPFDQILREMGLVAVRTRTRPRIPMHLGEIAEAFQRLSEASLVTPEDVRPFLRRLVPGLDHLGDRYWAKLPRRVTEAYMMARAPQAVANFLELDDAHAPAPEASEQMRSADLQDAADVLAGYAPATAPTMDSENSENSESSGTTEKLND